jgi:hypothetical protein
MTQNLGKKYKMIKFRSIMFKFTSKSISSGMLGRLANNPNFRLPLKLGTPLRSSPGVVEGPAAALAELFLFLRIIWLGPASMMVIMKDFLHHRAHSFKHVCT